MIRKSNKVLIGVFVIVAIVLLITAIVIFGSGALFKRADKYVLYFDGSIKGLSVGAPVIFRGVKIGNVSDISLVYNPVNKEVIIPVVIDVELARVEGLPDKIGYPNYKRIIERGIRGKLEIQSFITGQLMIAFDYYPDRPAKLHDFVNKHPELPVLPISKDIFEIMNEIPIKEISKQLEQTVAGMNRLVNSEGLIGLDKTLREITEAMRSIHFFVEYLEQHPEALLKGKPINKGDRK
ncbi:MAG: MlaD family protein [Candidatus Omnitrophica bacterium]|nr:MlaD family protein [Candidatus Omnitrophota bacterium]